MEEQYIVIVAKRIVDQSPHLWLKSMVAMAIGKITPVITVSRRLRMNGL